jgi:hypothetical protein
VCTQDRTSRIVSQEQGNMKDGRPSARPEGGPTPPDRPASTTVRPPQPRELHQPAKKARHSEVISVLGLTITLHVKSVWAVFNNFLVDATQWVV